jgi:hypothetical protein
MRRRKFLIAAAAAAALGGGYCAPRILRSWKWSARLSALPDMDYLREAAGQVIAASRVQPGQSVAGSPANTTGAPLIRPGGRADYPACWVRDFAMSLDCGLIPAAEIHHHLRLFARTQNGPQERRLRSRGVIPPFAIADHINFDGGAVFYPGSYSPGDAQGGGAAGVLPPVDDHYYFVHTASCLYRIARDPAFLAERVNGLPMLDRLINAFDAPASDETTGAVTTDTRRRAVGFGFFDSVFMTGAMLFATLLRYQAARELAELCRAVGRVEDITRLNQIADRIAAHLPDVFSSAEGWLKASTGFSPQPDVWGTLFALRMKILPDEIAARARACVAQAVRDGTIEYRGAVRHVPTTHDAGPRTAWQSSVADYNTYQNGAYWHTASGWLVSALREQDKALAQQVLDRYLAHLRSQDFRRGDDFGAPWECFGRDGAAQQNPVYMTSVTLPLAVLSG